MVGVRWISCRVSVAAKAGSGSNDLLYFGITNGGEEWPLGQGGYETGKSYRFVIGDAPATLAPHPSRPDEVVVRLGKIRRVKDYVSGVGQHLYLRKTEGRSDAEDDSLLLNGAEIALYSQKSDSLAFSHTAFLGSYRLSRAVGQWVWLGDAQFNDG